MNNSPIEIRTLMAQLHNQALNMQPDSLITFFIHEIYTLLVFFLKKKYSFRFDILRYCVLLACSACLIATGHVAYHARCIETISMRAASFGFFFPRFLFLFCFPAFFTNPQRWLSCDWPALLSRSTSSAIPVESHFLFKVSPLLIFTFFFLSFPRFSCKYIFWLHPHPRSSAFIMLRRWPIKERR